MAKKKKKKGTRRRRSSPKRSSPKKDKSQPAFTTAGGLVSVKKVFLDKTADGQISVVETITYPGLTPMERVTKMVDKTIANAMTFDKVLPLLGGMAADYIKPKKVSRIIRKLTKGRLS